MKNRKLCFHHILCRTPDWSTNACVPVLSHLGFHALFFFNLPALNRRTSVQIEVWLPDVCVHRWSLRSYLWSWQTCVSLLSLACLKKMQKALCFQACGLGFSFTLVFKWILFSVKTLLSNFFCSMWNKQTHTCYMIYKQKQKNRNWPWFVANLHIVKTTAAIVHFQCFSFHSFL